MVDAPATAVHGKDWQTAKTAVSTQLESLIPIATMEAEFARSHAFSENWLAWHHLGIMRYYDGEKEDASIFC